MKFTDNEGREWSCNITVGVVDRVLEGADIDLLKALEGDIILELSSNLRKFVEVLWCIIEPQAVEKNISSEQFGESLGGDSLGNALDAFFEGLQSFFGRPEQRKLLGDVISKVNQALGTAYTVGSEKIESMDIDKITREETEKLLADSKPGG